jgi:hypothetical protein
MGSEPTRPMTSANAQEDNLGLIYLEINAIDSSMSGRRRSFDVPDGASQQAGRMDLGREQWHPLFAQLLRPIVQKYYEIEMNMPVGAIPRAADIVLLRRTTKERPPFQGLWRNLTTWNVVEFKGRSVSPRAGDIDLLVELGLGIDRRLNEKRAQEQLPSLAPDEVSFWYIANQLGRSFLDDCRDRLGALESWGNGVWRCPILRRMVFLVSSAELPIDSETILLHLLGDEPHETELALARFVIDKKELWETYLPWLPKLHPTAWAEVITMARSGLDDIMKIDLAPLLQFIDKKQVIDLVSLDEVIKRHGKKKLLKKIIADLTPDERRELKRRLR